jgi:hypothetical protein
MHPTDMPRMATPAARRRKRCLITVSFRKSFIASSKEGMAAGLIRKRLKKLKDLRSWIVPIDIHHKSSS